MNSCLAASDAATVRCWEAFFAPPAVDPSGVDLETGDLLLAVVNEVVGSGYVELQDDVLGLALCEPPVHVVGPSHLHEPSRNTLPGLLRVAVSWHGDEREGGALLFYRMQDPIDITKSTRETPSPMVYVEQARKQTPGVWIDIEKPFWWDVPVWLASGKMHSIGVANNHMWRSQMLTNEAWGRERDIQRLPSPLGNGYWTQEIYYHILNTGIRIPPSAGSASGVLGNPLGYNRVYVHLEGEFSETVWWDGLAKGNCFVTNGPLLRVRANDRLPGAVFTAGGGEPLALKLDLQLTTLDRLRKLEVIQNGKVMQAIPCNGDRNQAHSLTLTVNESGWFLIRGITENPKTFRFASTAPFYTEFGQEKGRISKSSSRFFLDWVNERIERVKANITDKSQQAEVLRSHESARKFWQERVRQSNAD